MARSWAFWLKSATKYFVLFHTMSNFQHSYFTCRSNGRILCLQVCAWEVYGETETFPKSSHAPESETGERCSPVKRKRRSAIPLFKFREHCICCGETCAIDKACNNPNRWVPAYLVTEVDTKEVDERGKHVTSKDKILKQ